MKKDAISVIIHKIVAETFNPGNNSQLADQIADYSVSLTRLSDSSLKLVALCMDIEEKLGIEIELADLLNNPSIDLFSSHLAKLVTAGK